MDRLQSMRVFQRVVDEGSFAGAARALDLAPAVVTRLVADLEAHLGVRLLQRSTRRLALTEAGEGYLARLRGILQDLDDADAAASSHAAELSGLLRVHVPPVLATYVVAPMLAGFRQRHPRIAIDLEVASPPAPPIEDYDLCLFGADRAYDADVVARRVVESDAILVASPAYLAKRPAPRTPAELAGHDCLRLRMSTQRPRRWRLWRTGRPDEVAEVAVDPVMWANHSDTLLRAAVDGAGITSSASDLVAPMLMRGELVRVLSPWITGRLTMYAALPSRKFVPPRTRVFLDELVDYARRTADEALAACTRC